MLIGSFGTASSTRCVQAPASTASSTMVSDWCNRMAVSPVSASGCRASLKALKMFLHPSLNCFAYPVAQLQAGQQRRNVLFQIDRKIDRAASFQGWVAAVQAQREVQFAALIQIGSASCRERVCRYV